MSQTCAADLNDEDEAKADDQNKRLSSNHKRLESEKRLLLSEIASVRSNNTERAATVVVSGRDQGVFQHQPGSQQEAGRLAVESPMDFAGNKYVIIVMEREGGNE